jgi:response regulator NasT
MEAGAQALLINPIEAKDVYAAFTTAIYQQSRQVRLEDDSRGLRDKLAERKLIEKAKGILMESANVSESEAFRLIRRQSQNKRKPMGEIATLIISATELVRSARASAE